MQKLLRLFVIFLFVLPTFGFAQLAETLADPSTNKEGKKNFWFVPEVMAERRKNRALKHIYDKSDNDPAKKQAWKTQEKILTNMYKKYKKKDREGELSKVATPKDMARIAKYAKSGPTKEIALVKNAQNQITPVSKTGHGPKQKPCHYVLKKRSP